MVSMLMDPLAPLQAFGIVPDALTATDELGFPRILSLDAPQPWFQPGARGTPSLFGALHGFGQSLFGNNNISPGIAATPPSAFFLRPLGPDAIPPIAGSSRIFPFISTPGLLGNPIPGKPADDEDDSPLPANRPPAPSATEIAQTKEQLAQVGAFLERRIVDGYNQAISRRGERIDTKKHEDGRTFQTYTRNQLFGPKVYAGRTSGFGDPDANVEARYWTLGSDFGKPNPDRSSDAYSAIRGREQQLIDYYRRKGASANILNGISLFNPMRGYYLAKAIAQFGPCC